MDQEKVKYGADAEARFLAAAITTGMADNIGARKYINIYNMVIDASNGANCGTVHTNVIHTNPANTIENELGIDAEIASYNLDYIVKNNTDNVELSKIKERLIEMAGDNESEIEVKFIQYADKNLTGTTTYDIKNDRGAAYYNRICVETKVLNNMSGYIVSMVSDIDNGARSFYVVDKNIYREIIKEKEIQERVVRIKEHKNEKGEITWKEPIMGYCVDIRYLTDSNYTYEVITGQKLIDRTTGRPVLAMTREVHGESGNRAEAKLDVEAELEIKRKWAEYNLPQEYKEAAEYILSAECEQKTEYEQGLEHDQRIKIKWKPKQKWLYYTHKKLKEVLKLIRKK